MIKASIETLKHWATRLKSEICTLYVAMRDPRTPAYARYVAVLVIGYALSPIDLVPDFIPILGLLDDLILLPLGIALLQKVIPPQVMAASKRQAEAMKKSGLPANHNAAMIVLAIWALVLTTSILWMANHLIYHHHNNTEELTTQSDDSSSQHRPDEASITSNDAERKRIRQR